MQAVDVEYLLQARDLVEKYPQVVVIALHGDADRPFQVDLAVVFRVEVMALSSSGHWRQWPGSGAGSG